jgi:hypothetical protein
VWGHALLRKRAELIGVKRKKLRALAFRVWKAEFWHEYGLVWCEKSWESRASTTRVAHQVVGKEYHLEHWSMQS